MAPPSLVLPTGRPRPSKVAETNDDAQISKLCVGLATVGLLIDAHYDCVRACRGAIEGSPFFVEIGHPNAEMPFSIMSVRSCVRLGYFSDPYVHYFVKHPAIRPPLINRGGPGWWLAGLEHVVAASLDQAAALHCTAA